MQNIKIVYFFSMSSRSKVLVKTRADIDADTASSTDFFCFCFLTPFLKFFNKYISGGILSKNRP